MSSEYALPPSDEPVDFRRQAATYARYRRDYSSSLYDAIEELAGRAAGRRAVDLGCGTGFVSRTLARRGWRVTGADFSAPMLAEARRFCNGGVSLTRSCAEALPLRDATASLLTSGTAFHWFAPAPTLAEIARVLVPGGWAALFWRYDAPGEPYMRLVADVLRGIGVAVPPIEGDFKVHTSDPFAGSMLVAEPPHVIESELEFTAEAFHGYVSTLEWLRRFAGARHDEFLAVLRDALARRYPDGFRQRTEQYLYLARKPGA